MATRPDSVGDLYAAALDFRERTLRRDEQTAQLLADAYSQVFDDVLPYFDDLSRVVSSSVTANQVFTVDRMRRLDRYTALLDQVRNRSETFASLASTQVEQAQRVAVARAQAESQRLMRLAVERALLDVPDELGRGALPPGIPISVFNRVFNRVPDEALQFLIGSLGDGTPLRTYFLDGGVTDDAPPLAGEVIDQIQRNLAEALAAGWNPRKAAQLFRQAMGVGLNRALRISRTEMLRGYREASRYNYLANGFEEWEWLAALDGRTCLACIGLDGEVFPIEQPMQSHVNCRCTMVPVLPFRVPRVRRVADGAIFEGTGADWFDSLPTGRQLELMGPAKFELWQAGGLTLRDFRHEDTRRSATFGTQFVEATLAMVRARVEARN